MISLLAVAADATKVRSRARTTLRDCLHWASLQDTGRAKCRTKHFQPEVAPSTLWVLHLFILFAIIFNGCERFTQREDEEHKVSMSFRALELRLATSLGRGSGIMAM